MFPPICGGFSPSLYFIGSITDPILINTIIDENNWNPDGYYIGSMEGLKEGNYYLSYDVERLKKVEYFVLKDGDGNLRLIRHYVNNV